jgi:hypothetical protein
MMNEIPWFKMDEYGWEMSYIPVQLSPDEEFIVEPLGMKAVKFKYVNKKEGL